METPSIYSMGSPWAENIGFMMYSKIALSLIYWAYGFKALKQVKYFMPVAVSHLAVSIW